jgi:hypothetical protein
MSDVSQVVAEILAGRHDGGLLTIVEAVKERLSKGTTRFCWRLRYDDLEVTEETVTVGEIRLVEKSSGVNWMELDPATSAEHFAALLTVLLHTRSGMKSADATAAVEAIPMGELLDHLTQYELAPAPKD